MGQFHVTYGKNGTHPNFGDKGQHMTLRTRKIGMCPYFHVEEHVEHTELTHYLEGRSIDNPRIQACDLRRRGRRLEQVAHA